METLTETYQQETSAFAPAVPQTLEETGLSESMVQQLMLRILYFRGDITGRELSRVLGLNYSVIDESIDFLKQQYFISVKKSMGMGNVSSTLSLSEAGLPVRGNGSGPGEAICAGRARTAPARKLADTRYAEAGLCPRRSEP